MVSRPFSKIFRKKPLLSKSHTYYEGLFPQTIWNFNEFKLHFLRDLLVLNDTIWGSCFTATLSAACLCPIMCTATPGKSRTGESLWQKARVNLDKLVEKNILSLESSKQNKIKTTNRSEQSKKSENLLGISKFLWDCICSGANQAGKMPLPKSPSCSREQRSKVKQNSNLGNSIQN